MQQSTYGVFGHVMLRRNSEGLLLYTTIFALTAFSIAVRIRQRKVSAIDLALIGIPLLYVFILMQIVNYPTYLRFHEFHIAVAGRYLFPLVLPIYAIIAKYVMSVSNRRFQLGIATTLAIIFLYGDFIFVMTEWEFKPFVSHLTYEI